MKTLVIISVLFAAANAQFFPGFRPYFPSNSYGGNDEYAASLANAPVGLYSKTRPGGYGGNGPFGSGYGPFGGGYGGSDVSGASLGGAKVGLYGKERPQQSYPSPILPLGVPFGFPVRRPVQVIRSGFRPPIRPVFRPPVFGPRY